MSYAYWPNQKVKLMMIRDHSSTLQTRIDPLLAPLPEIGPVILAEVIFATAMIAQDLLLQTG